VEGGGEGVAVRADLATGLARLAASVMLGMLTVDVADVLGHVMLHMTTVTTVLLGALFLQTEAFALLSAVQSLAATLAGSPLRGGVMLGTKAFVVLAVDAVGGMAVGVHDAAAGLPVVTLVLHMAAVLALLGFVIDFPGVGPVFRLVAQVHLCFVDAAGSPVMTPVMFMMLHGSTLKPA